MEANPSLSEKLRTLREQRGVSAAEVAEAVGISRGFLSAIETGHDLPGRETLIALATYYGRSVDWLAMNEADSDPARAARAQTEEEALWLWAYRTLPPEEAKAHLDLLLARIRPGGS